MSYPTKYLDILKRIYDQNLFFSVKMGLTKMKALNKKIGSPSFAVPSIHVTGTNGKGSVTTKIANALIYSGYKTGMFVSPHISCFRERFTINGEMISEKEIEELMPEIFQAADEVQNISFFELITALAFKYFAMNTCDFSVVEVGLGGRLDATNILKPKVSVITSVGLDHQGILGNTIEEIAFEKAGIMKYNAPVIIGPDAPHYQLQKLAQMNHSPYFPVLDTENTFDQLNSDIAEKAIRVLKSYYDYDIPETAITKALETKPPCRFEELTIQKFGKSSRVILDVGHNRQALHFFLKTLQTKYPGKKYKVISGFCGDKNVSDCIEEILNVIPVENMSIIKSQHPRGMKPDVLKNTIKSVCEQKNITWSDQYVPYDTIPATIDRELSSLGSDEVLVINGSLYIMGEVRNALGIQEPLDAYVDYVHKNPYATTTTTTTTTTTAPSKTFMYPHEKPVEWK
ncbi:hypothetical protein WA158_005420 [Blastocystis sp. Blastoise]